MPSSLIVREFDGDPAVWDRFVRDQAGWTHFHLHGWKGVYERTYGHRGVYLAAYDGEVLKGVLPLVYVRSLVFGKFLVSSPFVSYGGPLGESAAIQALADDASSRAKQLGVKLLELRSRGALPLTMPVSLRKITVVLDLPADSPKPLWDSLDANVRRRVRRAEKAEITTRFGPDELLPFYRVFSRHMRDLGTPVHARRLFEELLSAFPDDIWFGCSYYQGQPIACIGGFEWNGEFEVTWASALFEHKQLAANMLIYWNFIERSIERGLRVFNFGRCTPDGGTHRFKRQWEGAKDEQLHWYQDRAADVAGTPSPDDPSYAWGPRLWKRLPRPLADVLGPRIVRGIP
jgi:FemAB-related protein (PEP-CTERM system-associated)